MSILSESNLNSLSTPIGKLYFIKLHISSKLLQCDTYDHKSAIIVDAVRSIINKLKTTPIAIMDRYGLEGFFTSVFTSLGDYNEVDYGEVEEGYRFTVSQDHKQTVIQVTFTPKCRS